jgi:hypothetical protein
MKMKKFFLKKIIVISILLAISFVTEFFLNKIIFNIDCFSSFLKLELLPIILIGFLFGFKFSFFANLLYIIIHIIFEFAISSQKHGFLTDVQGNNKLLLSLLLFVFIIPYLSCSISGLSYFFNKKGFYKKKIFFLIFSFIIFIQFISYFLFSLILFQNMNQKIEHFIENLKYITKIIGHNYNPIYFFLIYYFISILTTNIVIGFILYYFFQTFLKNNEEIFYINEKKIT